MSELIVVTYKVCTRCHVSKALEEFPVDPYSNKPGRNHRRQSWCNPCSWANRNNGIRELYEAVAAFKVNEGCADCGYDEHPAALHFDHLPGNEKLFNVAVGIQRTTAKKVWAEIAKCEVVCANCHAIRTSERREAKV